MRFCDENSKLRLESKEGNKYRAPAKKTKKGFFFKNCPPLLVFLITPLKFLVIAISFLDIGRPRGKTQQEHVHATRHWLRLGRKFKPL